MGRKHWKKEKLLVMSDFSFSCSVFKRLLQQTCKNQGLFGKRLIAIFRLSSAASLNLGWSQNGVIWNGLYNHTIIRVGLLPGHADILSLHHTTLRSNTFTKPQNLERDQIESMCRRQVKGC